MSKKILVVDDEEYIREAMVDLFNSNGYDAQCAESGHSAFEICVKENFDIVISDVRMPDGDGLELANNLFEKFGQKLPVVFVTGYLDCDDITIPINVVEVVKKPVRFTNLNKVIIRILNL